MKRKRTTPPPPLPRVIPERLKVEGDLFHGRIPDGAVYVGRQAPGLRASAWANPYSVKAHGREKAVQLYSEHLERHPELADQARQELAGRDLACWCPLGEPCHADVLLRIANGAA